MLNQLELAMLKKRPALLKRGALLSTRLTAVSDRLSRSFALDLAGARWEKERTAPPTAIRGSKAAATRRRLNLRVAGVGMTGAGESGSGETRENFAGWKRCRLHPYEG
jgi:hypothetical protein